MQKTRNAIANALELCLFCTKIFMGILVLYIILAYSPAVITCVTDWIVYYIQQILMQGPWCNSPISCDHAVHGHVDDNWRTWYPWLP